MGAVEASHVSPGGSRDQGSPEDIRRPLEAEILSHLVSVRRTASELTEAIYGVTRSNPSYHTYYMKVSRAVKELQKRGYVSTRLFGRDKPYKLTPYAAAHMMKIGQGSEEKVVSVLDAVVYALTFGLGVTNLFLAGSAEWLGDLGTIIPYSVFLILVGYCTACVAADVKKVS